MPTLNVLKDSRFFSPPVKRTLGRFPPGKRVRLRDGVYKQVKDRVWILSRIDKDGVHLLHESMVYGLIVKREDIDWNESDGNG